MNQLTCPHCNRKLALAFDGGTCLYCGGALEVEESEAAQAAEEAAEPEPQAPAGEPETDHLPRTRVPPPFQAVPPPAKVDNECPSCLEAIPRGTRWCPHCGREVPSTAPSAGRRQRTSFSAVPYAIIGALGACLAAVVILSMSDNPKLTPGRGWSTSTTSRTPRAAQVTTKPGGG